MRAGEQAVAGDGADGGVGVGSVTLMATSIMVSPVPTTRTDAPSQMRALIRHLAHQRGVDLSVVRGTGPSGKITREDVEHAAPVRITASPLARRLAAELNVDLSAVTGSGYGGVVIKAAALALREVPRLNGWGRRGIPHRICVRRPVRGVRSGPVSEVASRPDTGRPQDLVLGMVGPPAPKVHQPVLVGGGLRRGAPGSARTAPGRRPPHPRARRNASLLVLATHDHPGRRRLTADSVGHYRLSYAACPVATVPGEPQVTSSRRRARLEGGPAVAAPRTAGGPFRAIRRDAEVKNPQNSGERRYRRERPTAGRSR